MSERYRAGRGGIDAAWCSALAAFLLLPLVHVPVAPAQTRVSEYDVEAAYLYNFGKFVRWPADVPVAQKSFDICILGHDPFGATLARLIAGDQIDGREIHERAIAAAPEAAGCAIVYIADSEEANARKTIAALSGKGQLLVSDLPHFLDEGGMIQFVVAGSRVRFEVNLETAASSRLSFSSELLKVAIRVVGIPRGGVSP
jgi:hypothetical protein